MAAQCKECGLEIRWMKPLRTDGKSIPVDVSPDPDLGTVRQRISGPDDKPIVCGEILKGDALDTARADGERLWMRHAETCTAHKPYNPRPAGLVLNLPAAPTRRDRRRFR